tara:strand:+ start:484 stop:675 length:192 start_codon:yes stop_codon:yes gene_type:complete
MDNLNKMRALKDKMNELQNLVEDFLDSNQAKSNKIKNLEREIIDIKTKVNSYLDDIEELVDEE